MSTIQCSYIMGKGDVALGLGGQTGGSITGNGYIYLEPKSKLDGQTAGQIYAPGMIIQTAYAQTTRDRYTIATQDISNIPGLSISFAAKYSTSWLLLTSMINSTQQHVCTFGFMANGGYITNITNTNSAGSLCTTYMNDDTTDYIHNAMIMDRYYPGTTGAITYTVGASASWAGSVRSLYINDRASNDMRSTSTFTIMEIAV